MTTPRDIRDYLHLYLRCNVILDPGTATESTERMTGILMSAFVGEDNQLFAQVEMRTLISTSHRNHPINRLKVSSASSFIHDRRGDEWKYGTWRSRGPF